MAPPTPAEWEDIRAIFTELYERLSLKDVRIELASRGFHASERMYRTRIQLWRLAKNDKKNATLRGTREHGVDGEMSLKGINSRHPRIQGPVNLSLGSLPRARRYDPDSNVPSYMERQDQLLEVLGAIDQNVHAPSLVKALRRLSNEIPEVLTPQRWEKSWTNCVRSIEQHYIPLSSDLWTLGTLESDKPELYPSIKFGSLFFQYHSTRTLGDQETAVSTIDEAFGMARPLLLQPDPRLLTYFLESIAYTRAQGYSGLVKYMILHFLFEARTILGLGHPLTVFMASLHQSDDAKLDKVIYVGIRCIIDQFCARIGTEHVETMRLLLTASMILKHQKAFDEAFDTLQTLVGAYQVKYGRCSYQVCHALVDQAYIKMEQARYGQATDLLDRAMGLLDGIIDWNEQIESRVRCRVCFAAVSGAMGNLVRKKDHLQLALEIGELQLDDEHWMMRDARASLVTVSSQLQ